MTIGLSKFFAELDRQEEQLSLDELTTRMRSLSIGLNDVSDYVRFSSDGYQRNLMRSGPTYETLILCWQNGQRSPVHDHRGSNCGVLVIKGTATETLFEHKETGGNRPTTSMTIARGITRTLQEGSVCGSNDMDTHQISNVQPNGEALVTMHIYSPPLGAVGVYSLADNTVELVRSPTCVLTPNL